MFNHPKGSADWSRASFQHLKMEPRIHFSELDYDTLTQGTGLSHLNTQDFV